jgi:FixJ family two-component response regulator
MKPAVAMEDDSIVYVVDDDSSVRETLNSLIRSVGFRVQPFASARDFLGGKLPRVPGCLIFDVRLPGSSGLDLQQDLARAGIQIPIIFITEHGDIPPSVRTNAGACEFLTKPFRDQDLLDAIRQAVARDRALRREREGTADLQERFRTLTPRERQVMRLVVCGLMNKQVGAELGTSEATVKLQRRQVMHKMQAGSLAELVTMAGRLGTQDGK